MITHLVFCATSALGVRLRILKPTKGFGIAEMTPIMLMRVLVEVVM